MSQGFPFTDTIGTRIQQIIPAGDWVAVRHWPQLRLFEIFPVACWALGDVPADRQRGLVYDEQNARGLISQADDCAPGLTLVDEEGQGPTGDENEIVFVGYFPNEAIAVKRIQRCIAPVGASTVKLLDGSVTDIVGTRDERAEVWS